MIESPTAPSVTMGAEAGYAVEETPPPIRVTGFAACGFGLFSVLCLLALPLLLLPFLAIVFGLIALRPYQGERPVGVRPAKLGILLAAGFGAAGLLHPYFIHRTIGGEASYFARQYLMLVAQGDYEMAMELAKRHGNRLPNRMSLRRHYSPLRAEADPGAEFPNSVANYDMMEGIADLVEIGPSIELVEAKPARVYSRYGRPRVDTFWNNKKFAFRDDLKVTLEYVIDSGDRSRQWFVTGIAWDRDQPIAEGNY